MEQLEKEIELYLVNKKEYSMVNSKKVYIIDNQVKLGKYILDVLGLDEDGNIYAIELKKDRVDGNALSQVLAYMDYIKLFNSQTKYIKKIYGVLVGDSLTDYMESGINQLDNIFYIKYGKTFNFEEQVWSWKEEYINSNELKKHCDTFNELTIGEERDADNFNKQQEVKDNE